MVRTHAQILRQRLKQLADGRANADDADALRRHRAGDPDAFPDIVHRHGPMVYGVCRRVLGPTPDADDAFQATFLALVRNPSSVRNANALPAWLHRVALRTARKALARRKPVRPSDEAVASRDPDPAEQAAWEDVRRALDEELDRLPLSLRAPLVLCYLDAATRDEAARRLGLTVATLDRRLAAGRARLRDRLVRRGFGAVVLGTAVFADGLRATVPADLARLAATVTPASASPAVRALAVHTTGRARIATAVLLLGGLAATLVGAAVRPGGDEPPRPQAPAPAAPKGAPAEAGEALPDGAVARIGSTRFRHLGLSDFVWSPDGKAIVTVGATGLGDGVLRSWDPETGRPTKAVVLARTTASRFALSDDGRVAFAAGREPPTVFDGLTGNVLAKLPAQKERLTDFELSPDGRLLVVVTDDGRMTVRDWRAGTSQAVPVAGRPKLGLAGQVRSRFSPDGKRFAVGVGEEPPLTVFNVTGWEQICRLDCGAATCAFTPDGTRLVAASKKDGPDKVLRVFDVDTAKEVATFPVADLETLHAISPDGRLAVCSGAGRGSVVDLTTGKVLRPLARWGSGGWMSGGRFSPDGKSFVANTLLNHLRLWDVATGDERHGDPGGFGGTLAAAASPDGRLLATADWDHPAVSVWDTATGRRVREIPLAEKERLVQNLTFATDGRTLAAGQALGVVHEWEVATGKELRKWHFGGKRADTGREANFHFLRRSADGRRVVGFEEVITDRETSRLSVWDAATGKLVREVAGLPGEPRRRFAWTPDGETLALGLDSMETVLIDLDTGAQRARLDGGIPSIDQVPMSPDGRLLGVVRDYGKKGVEAVGVYEVATGKAVARVPARGFFAIGSDNRTLVTADGTSVRAWDLATGQEVARRPIPQSPGGHDKLHVRDIVPLAGRRVFTRLIDGTGLVWDFAPAAPSGKKADSDQLAAWWVDLRADDPAKAYAAVWRLMEVTPDTVVPFLARHLRPQAAPDPAKLQKLVADLDSDTFPVREKATKELQELGPAAAPALRKALEAKAAPETAQRIEQLLAHKPGVASRPDQLRRLRAMQVLERLGTPEARKVLSDLAGGMPEAAETKEAQAALGRK